LEALLHENSCLTLTEFAESLGVDHTTVSKCLKVLGMIQQQGHWMLYELKSRDVERHSSRAKTQLLQRQKRKGFLHRIVTAHEFTMIMLSVEDCEINPTIHQHRRKSRISMI